MAVNDILEKIENLVVDAHRVVFTNKCIIEENDLYRLVDDLRGELPVEIQQSVEIVQEKQAIIDEANEQAAKIVEQAKAYAVKLTEENEIVQQAKEQARLIMQQTQEQEKEIMEKTMQSSQQLKADANQYANQVFDHLLTNVGSALNIVQQAKSELDKGNEDA